jgi:hypothetical protein
MDGMSAGANVNERLPCSVGDSTQAYQDVLAPYRSDEVAYDQFSDSTAFEEDAYSCLAHRNLQRLHDLP